MEWQQYLFSFQGRVNRAKWWLGFLIQAVLAFAAIVPFLAISPTNPILGMMTGVAIYIVMIWVGLVVGGKRLHDRDKSAWFLLVFYAVPPALALVSRSEHGLVPIAAELAISIWMLVELGCLRGTPGPNRFGPDPLGRAMPVGTVAPVMRG